MGKKEGIHIEKLYSGYGLDSNGYIVSDVHQDNIDDVYFPCIHESVERLKAEFHQQLHSVYLYGSVARGDAIIQKSDLDLIAMFDTKLSPTQLTKLKILAEELSQKYYLLVRDVGIATAYYDYTFDHSNYYENAFLRELCVCIYGEDVGEKFGPYKLTSEIPISFNSDIQKALERVLVKLEKASKEDFKLYTQGFARKLIRTFYSMVMVRSQIWTTKLNEQSEVFLHYFPEKSSTIYTLLKWLKEPPEEQEKVYSLFKREGKWASENFINEAETQ